jgi:hypothetical protein
MANTEILPAHRRKKGALDAWFDHMLRRYFGQKRAIWSGHAKDGHEFGWSAMSVMGRLREERDGASQPGNSGIKYAEVFTEDALLVRRAIEGVAYDPYVTAHIHYIVPASVKIKAREAGYSPAGYYQHLEVFHEWTRGRILLLEPSLADDRAA